MLALKPETRLALRDDITIQAIPELNHYYAFNIKNGDHFQLNHTAYWILEEVGTEMTLTELSDKFGKTFELEQDVAERDLCEVIKFALGNNIVKEVRNEQNKKAKTL